MCNVVKGGVYVFLCQFCMLPSFTLYTVQYHCSEYFSDISDTFIGIETSVVMSVMLMQILNNDRNFTMATGNSICHSIIIAFDSSCVVLYYPLHR